MNILTFIWENILYNPILNILVVLYEVGFQNLGIAVVLLTVIIRFALLPLTRNQLESAQKLQDIRPDLEKIQKKYKNDPKVLQQKQMELYKSINYNPVGCLSSFIIQLPILFALYAVVKNFAEGNLTGVYPFIVDIFKLQDIKVNTYFWIIDLAKSQADMGKAFGNFSKESIPYIIIAVLVGISQYLSMRFVTGSKPKVKEVKKNPKKEEQANPQEMMKVMNSSMLLYMPLMTGFISLSLPAILSVYWIVNSIIQVVQQFIIGDKDFIVNKTKVRWDEFIHRKPKTEL